MIHPDIQRAIDKYREIEAISDSKHVIRLDSVPLEPSITETELQAILDYDESVLPAFLQYQAF